jgi:hypothetical protein
MNLVPTELNQRLAQAVRHSVDAERFYIAGRSVFWRFIGLGAVTLGLGAAVGLGFFGYSYVKDNSNNLDVLSSTFSRALSEIQLRVTAEGAVQIEPRELSLAKDQTISIDPKSRILLDPNAKVLANGELKVEAPSISVPQGRTGSTANRPSNVPVITNFTVFKTVPFGSGSIMTGWEFLTSTQKLPTHQYCYYTEDSESSGAAAIVYVGNDGKPETSAKPPQGVDMIVAFSKCVWFKGESQ